jgi:PAS domain S-box-containing protein
VDDVLITSALDTRPSRAPDFEAENRALVELTAVMAETPKTVVQRLADVALELCRAGSAGVSMLEPGPEGVFRGLATAGVLKPYNGGTTPRDLSLCGTVLDRNRALLMSDPARYYPFLADLPAPVREVLLVPFYRGADPIGTVWVVAHTDDRKFDAEDRRVVTSLTRLAGAAVQVLTRVEGAEKSELALRDAQARLETTLSAGEVGTWTWDVTADRVVADRNLARMFGVTAAEAAGGPLDTFTEAIHRDDRERVTRVVKRVLKEGESYETDYRIVRPTQDVCWVITRGRVERDAAGRATRVAGVTIDVTGQRRAEAEQFRSREALRAVLDTIPQRVFWKGTDLTYLGCNRQFARDMGYESPDEVVGKTDYQASWVAEAENFRADDRQVIDTAVPKLDFEEVLLATDGAMQWVRTSKVPLHDPDGRVVGVLGTYEDVTGRKRVEDELRLRDRAIRAATQGLVITDNGSSDHPLLYVSPGFERITGYSAAEVVGRSCRFLQGAGTDPAAVARLREAIRDGRAATVELLNYRRDGSSFWNEVSISPVAEADGRVSHFVGVLTDVTDRRRIKARMREQEELLRETSEMAHVGGWSFDPVTGQSEWTEETFRIHNLDPASGPSTVAQGIARYSGPDRERMETAVRAAREHGTPYDLELRFVAADGEQKWVRAICRPAVEGGKVVRVRGSLQDVTERHELEEKLRQSQKMDAFGQLAGGVAHDFNNMLQVINGYAAMLHNELPPGDPKIELVDEIRQAGKRSATLTRQLLAFARQEVVAPRVLDPSAAAADTVGMLRRLIGEDVRLVTDLGPGVWPVLIDPGQLEQVLLNLAVNARDAMADGGTLTVTARNERVTDAAAADHADARPGPYAVLSLADTGTGMPPEVLARVFEPFFTTKEVGKGTGLGLATVYGIVRQAGGHVRARSRVGEGSTFEVFLPRTRESKSDEAGKEGTRALPRGTETVLVVEDEAAVRGLVRKVLSGCGYRVLIAADGVAAERVAAEHAGPIHLVLSDVVMPGAGGGGERISQAPRSEGGVHERVHERHRHAAGRVGGRAVPSKAVHARRPGDQGSANPGRVKRVRIRAGRNLPPVPPAPYPCVAVANGSGQAWFRFGWAGRNLGNCNTPAPYAALSLPDHPVDAQAQVPEFVPQGRAVQAEPLAGVAEVPAGFLQHAFEKGSLHDGDHLGVKVVLALGQQVIDHGLHVHAVGVGGARGALRPALQCGRQKFGQQKGPGGAEHGLLQHALEFADVPGPPVVSQADERLRVEALHVQVQLLVEDVEEVVGQFRDVFWPLPQRRHGDRDPAEAVVKVRAEATVGDPLLEVLVRGRDDPHAGLDGLPAADPLELLLLQEPEHLGLGRERHVADLVQEDRPVVALLELADPLPVRPGERAPLVAEQLALDQPLGQRGTVDGEERLVGPAAVVVQRPGDQFLADAALAEDKDVHVLVGDAADHLAHLLDDGRPAHERLARLQARQHGRNLHQVRGLEGPAEDVRHAAELERLDEIVEGPLLHGLDGDGRGAVCGDEDHRLLGREGADGLEGLQPRTVRELEVQHHHVRLLLLVQFEAFRDGAGRDDAGRVVPEHAGERVTHARFIVHDE